MKEHFKKYWNLYLAVVLFIIGMFYYTRSYASDSFTYENKGRIFIFEHPLAIHHMHVHLSSRNCSTEYDKCKTNAQKVKFHKENAERCLNCAKERCWWLPNVADRDKSRYCFTNIGILVSPGEPKSKLIIALISNLVQYGIDCNNEWDYINDKLYWSQYHYEMMEFHQDLINKGYP